MITDDEGNVTLTVTELNHHLEVRGETARDVGVAMTAALILVADAFGFRWMAWTLLAVALVRITYAWRKGARTED